MIRQAILMSMPLFPIAIAIVIAVAGCQNNANTANTADDSEVVHMGSLKITSQAFQNMQEIPAKYTCDGQGINPPLSIEGIPAGAKSLVLIADDPDAPVRTWDHWIVWNIPIYALGTSIAEDSVPENAVQGKNSAGDNSYGGPCPPSGTHRYFFKVYALDSTLSLPNSSKKADVEKAMQGHILDKAELVGTYRKK